MITSYDECMFDFSLHKTDSATEVHNPLRQPCKNLKKLKSAILAQDLTDVYKLEVFKIVNTYGLSPARLVRGKVSARSFYIADKLKTCGEFIKEYDYCLHDSDEDEIPLSAPVIIERKAGENVVAFAHILNPECDIVLNKKLQQIYPMKQMRGRSK